MGKNNGPYKPDFPIGSKVRIVDLDKLKNFLDTWKLHNPLEKNQLDYHDKSTIVENVSFYHGGDELYTLKGIPGVWHPRCFTIED